MDTTFTETYIHVDTLFGLSGGGVVASFRLYESKAGYLPGGMPSGFNGYYFMDTLSGGKFCIEEAAIAPVHHLTKASNCWIWIAGSPDAEVRITNLVEDFGQRLFFYYYASPMPLRYEKLEVTYANLPGLTWGNKVNVLPLGVSQPGAIQAGIFTIQPNPANNQIRISPVAYGQPAQATLRNVSGQVVRQLHFSRQLTLATADLAPGLYFLEIAGKDLRQSMKVNVQH